MTEALDLLSGAAASPMLFKAWKHFFGGPKKWTIQQYVRNGHYTSQPSHTIGFVSLKLVKGNSSHKIEPEKANIGLDPMEENFSEKLADYWAKAEEAVAMMNAYDKS